MNAFHMEVLEGNVALVTFDVPGKKVNTLGKAVLMELGALLRQLAARTDLRGLLLASGKPGNFIAGADLKELAALPYLPKEAIEQAVSAGHELFSAMGQLPFPTVVLVDGTSMGGGTELALALDYRIASPQATFALPEVNLGIIPAWGGTQRMPRVIGVHHAVQMICSGETISADRARELDLVFDVVPSEKLIDEGRRLIELVHASQEWQKLRERRSQPVGLSDDQAGYLFAVAEGMLAAKTQGHYPAPLAALKAIRKGCNVPLEAGLAIERRIAMETFGEISANLISVFFAGQRLDRGNGVDDPDVKPREVRRTGVIGAGLMGAGIATALARRDVHVNLVDNQAAQLDKALANAEQTVAGRIKIGRATPQDMADMLARMNTGTGMSLVRDCDVVIEAVPELEPLKAQVYQALAMDMREDAILATNTSTISITRLAEAAPNAERFAGLHFFNPVDRMQLVEVVRGERTSDETVATLVALVRKIKKKPIVVRDCPGFLVNRILFPYMNEALALVQEGASLDVIDRAATEFGMPMGPIALYDLVGLDTAAYASKVMSRACGERMVKPDLLFELVKMGRHGQKSGAGFRKFTGKRGKAELDPDLEPLLVRHRTGQHDFTTEEIQDRLFLPMLLEATRALADEIVRDPAELDMGLILGIGFPPFRGGVLRWCDNTGAGEMLKRLEAYESLGPRYEPTPLLTELAHRGETFYPRPELALATGGVK